MARILSHYRDGDSWWFRVCGWGLVGHIASTHRPLFSERIGIRKFAVIGKWKIGVLKP